MNKNDPMLIQPDADGDCTVCGIAWSDEENAGQLMHECPPGFTSHRAVPVSAEDLERLRNTLDLISDVFHIGSAARTPATIVANVTNAFRRSECLSAVERTFFTHAVVDDDGEEGEECELNWGADPAEYVEQFRTALVKVCP